MKHSVPLSAWEGGKSHYRTRYTLNSQGQAERYYDCLNTHSGYKKRLITAGRQNRPAVHLRRRMALTGRGEQWS